MKITKIFFHFINILFIIFYIYPGSIFGYLIYGNLSKQPQVTPDFYFSSNHVYAFFIVSLLGFISCLLYTSPSPRDKRQSRMPSSA